MSYLIAALAASVLFIAAGWRSRRTMRSAMPMPRGFRNAGVLDSGNTADTAWLADGPDDQVATAVHEALRHLAPAIAGQAIQLDFAVRPGLTARMPAGTLTDTIEDMLGAAIRAAPASRLLVTAAPYGADIRIAVSDDIPGAEAAVQQARAAGLAARAEARGAKLAVEVHPAEGTTLTLILPAAIRESAGAAA